MGQKILLIIITLLAGYSFFISGYISGIDQNAEKYNKNVQNNNISSDTKIDAIKVAAKAVENLKNKKEIKDEGIIDVYPFKPILQSSKKRPPSQSTYNDLYQRSKSIQESNEMLIFNTKKPIKPQSFKDMLNGINGQKDERIKSKLINSKKAKEVNLTKSYSISIGLFDEKSKTQIITNLNENGYNPYTIIHNDNYEIIAGDFESKNIADEIVMELKKYGYKNVIIKNFNANTDDDYVTYSIQITSSENKKEISDNIKMLKNHGIKPYILHIDNEYTIMAEDSIDLDKLNQKIVEIKKMGFKKSKIVLK